MLKTAIEKIGIDIVLRRLLNRGHTVIAIHRKFHQYEFDIITKKENQLFVHEVRVTSLQDPQIVFPRKKLLTLIKGHTRYLPSAIIVLHQVTRHAMGVPTVHSYSISDLL